MNITLKELAEKLNVSISTVSKVMNGKGTVSDETRKRITETALKLNYTPNENARSLRTQNSKTIGLIIPDITNSFYAYLVKSIEEKCQAEGYSVILCNCNYNLQREYDYFDLLRAKNVNGIICAAVGNMKNIEIKPKEILVNINEQFPEDKLFDCISINNSDAMYSLTQYVINMGHKDIAYVNGPSVNATPRLRREGFFRCMQENDIPISGEFLYEGNYDFETGRSAAKKMLLGKRLPTAVICHNNVISYGFYSVLNEVGFDVPKDISMATFDTFDTGNMSKFKFTCIIQPVEQLGQKSVELILKKMNKEIPKSQFTKIVLPYELVFGSTIRNLNRTSEE